MPTRKKNSAVFKNSSPVVFVAAGTEADNEIKGRDLTELTIWRAAMAPRDYRGRYSGYRRYNYKSILVSCPSDS